MNRHCILGVLVMFLVLYSTVASGKQQGGRPQQISTGWKFDVARSIGMEGTETYQTGDQSPFRIFQKIVFREEVSKAAGNNIMEANREIKTAALHSLDPQRGRMVKQDLVSPGTRFRVSHSSAGSTLFNGSTGEEIWDTEMVAAFAPPLIPKLWPQGVLRRAQKWSYQGIDLVSRIGLIEILEGRIDLRVENLKPEPSTGLMTAAIRGELKTKVDLESIVLDYVANVEIDLPVALGVPFRVKFDGQLSGSGVGVDGMGQPIDFQIQATGTVLQIAKPNTAVIESVRGKPLVTKGTSQTKGSQGLASSDAKDHIKKSSGALADGKKKVSGGNASKPSGNGSPVYRYKLYEDTTERAFTVLIPDGWKTEGGIMQISPQQIRTIVDGCGKKLYFSIYDPVSQASITYYPIEIYHTSSFTMNMSPGQVLNGMVQMPQVMTPSQYVRQMIFPSTRTNVSKVEWGKLKNLTTLANAWHRAFHSDNHTPPLVRAESIEVAYDRSGKRFAELWTALITSTRKNDSTVWLPDFAVVAGAPIDRVEAIAPVLKAVITSFRMNPTWMARTIARFNECTEKVATTQEEIRAMARKISKRLMQVQKEVNRIDNEIVANRAKKNSIIQEHEHNTLMGEDEYEDTETGKRYIIDMGYERNYTNGDMIIQTDDWLFEPPPGYREMKNINITDD